MILLGLPVKTVAIKEPWLFLAKAIPLVEMVGVEPTSKNISEELSPSAVSALSFAVSAVTLTHYGTAIL